MPSQRPSSWLEAVFIALLKLPPSPASTTALARRTNSSRSLARRVATAADRRASDRVLCRAWWSGSRLGVESWPATRQDHACCGRKLHHQHAGTRKTAGHRPEFSRHEKYDERPLSFAKCERRARKPNTTARFVFLQSLRIESRPPKTEYDV